MLCGLSTSYCRGLWPSTDQKIQKKSFKKPQKLEVVKKNTISEKYKKSLKNIFVQKHFKLKKNVQKMLICKFCPLRRLEFHQNSLVHLVSESGGVP